MDVAVNDPEEVELLQRSTRAHVRRGVAQDNAEEGWEVGVPSYELPAF